ncbi:hypothetical protein R1flu_000466 [Riccia fluitans]|uniref:Uncharacterized protein n=1 Tax=Riccia fluitans TaxID=41844 RepID=A0ABD1Y0I7_9MARC
MEGEDSGKELTNVPSENTVDTEVQSPANAFDQLKNFTQSGTSDTPIVLSPEIPNPTPDALPDRDDLLDSEARARLKEMGWDVSVKLPTMEDNRQRWMYKSPNVHPYQAKTFYSLPTALEEHNRRVRDSPPDAEGNRLTIGLRKEIHRQPSASAKRQPGNKRVRLTTGESSPQENMTTDMSPGQEIKPESSQDKTPDASPNQKVPGREHEGMEPQLNPPLAILHRVLPGIDFANPDVGLKAEHAIEGFFKEMEKSYEQRDLLRQSKALILDLVELVEKRSSATQEIEDELLNSREKEVEMKLKMSDLYRQNVLMKAEISCLRKGMTTLEPSKEFTSAVEDALKAFTALASTPAKFATAHAVDGESDSEEEAGLLDRARTLLKAL